MRTLVLSTCGTSVLTNLRPDLRTLIYRNANVKNPQDVPAVDRQSLLALVNTELQDEIGKADPTTLSRLSAELNGILRLYDGRIAGSGQDIHWLISTDTWLGDATAQAVAGVLQRHGQQAEVKRITDLKTNDLDEFRLGTSELVRLCAQEVKSMRDGGYRVVFNLTGGFKSVQGFMQALGMLYADESIYVFENTAELLRLPRLPITLDVLDLARKHERLFRRHAVQLPLSAADVEDVPEALLMTVDDDTGLSIWGEAVWSEVGDRVLDEKLLPPIDAKLRFGDNFARTVESCSKFEIHQINERLADLARCLNDGTNPSRLDFKKLHASKGNSTHECDAWAQCGAKRLFGYFDGGVFVVVELAEGIH